MYGTGRDIVLRYRCLQANARVGFGLIALATIIYFWNVGFHYFVQLGLFVPEARWSKRDSDLIYALDAGAYIVGAVLDVLGIARLCKVYRSAPRAGSNHGLTGR
jgi:hypothetical protein